MFTRFLTLLIPIALILGLTAATYPVSNDSTVQTKTVFDRIYAPDIRGVRLETDMDALMDKEQLEYQPALFSLSGAADGGEWLINVKKRGRFRLKECDFAPLKLKFSKKDLLRMGLADHNKLKLVTHCVDDAAEAQENLLREYLAYRAYAILSPSSYRVQLIRITYADTHHRYPESEHWGFLLEDTDEMAERAGGLEYETYGLAEDDLNREALTTMQLFEFMIGNSDYSIPNMRNVKLVQSVEDNQVIPVPYDFDFAGWVNADYAIPNPDVAQVSVRQRVWMGNLPVRSELEKVFETFQQKRPELEALILNQPQLSDRVQKRMLRYLDQFYTRDVPRLLKDCPEAQS